MDAILPRKVEGRLKWDLKDSEGVYNSVDIDNALTHGYQIEVLEGYYWEKTDMVFDEYIQYLILIMLMISIIVCLDQVKNPSFL